MKGFAGGIDLAEDAGIAGEIVVEDGFLAERRGRGEEGLDGLARAAELVEAIGGVDPAAFLLRGYLGQLAGEGEGLAPFVLVDENEDAHLEDLGPMLLCVGEAIELAPGFAPEAEFVVTLRGEDALLEIFHGVLMAEKFEIRNQKSEILGANIALWNGASAF